MSTCQSIHSLYTIHSSLLKDNINYTFSVWIVIPFIMTLNPPGFDEKYGTKSNKTLAPWMQFLWHMDAEATKVMPQLGDEGRC